MKYYSFFMIAFLLFSCAEEKPAKPVVSATIEGEPETKDTIRAEFPHFERVMDALKATGDYDEPEGVLQLLSDSGGIEHVQVSRWVYPSDQEKMIEIKVKQDILLAVMRAFSLTSKEQLTITSLPVQVQPDNKTPGEYLVRYKQTLTVNRSAALRAVKRYGNVKNFKALYSINAHGTEWKENMQFEKVGFAEGGYRDRIFNILLNDVQSE